MSAFDFDRIVEQLKQRITENNETFISITNDIDISQEKILKVVRWLMDNNKIEETEGGILTWKKQSDT